MNETQLSCTLLALYGGGVLFLALSLVHVLRLLGQKNDVKAAMADGEALPAISVVVPVKDEEAHIRICIESILNQDYPQKRIIVVNDRSVDGTAAVVQSLQQTHPEIRLINIVELPAGLYGKPHALHVASRELSGEIFVFVDSDFELSPGCLRTLVSHFQANRLDWLAVMGRPELSGFWERLLIPAFGAVVYAWYDPRKISDPKNSTAIGSGFLLARREAYHAIGGHGAVVAAYDEDSEIVRIAKRAGYRFAYLLAPEQFRLQMYGSLERTLKGMERTLAGGIKTIPRLLFTIAALNFVSLMPIGIMAIAGVVLAKGWPVPFALGWLAVGALHMGISGVLALVTYRTAGASGRLSLLHPLAGLILIGVSFRAIGQLRRRGPIAWRDTVYTKSSPAPGKVGAG